MTVAELMRTLRNQRIAVWNDGGKLRYRAPQGALTDELRDQLRLHKSALLGVVPATEPVAEPVPVSFAQHAMWFLNRTMPESPAYNVAFAARVLSPIDVGALGRAAQALVDRHGSLRTLYEEEDGTPLAFVYPTLPVELRRTDASGCSEPALYELVMAAYRRPFALDRGPLVRFDLFSVGPAEHVLLISAHHIAMDGWSVWLVLDELRVLYARESGASSDTLPPIAADYADYARSQAAMLDDEEGKAHWAYWETQLAGELPTLELPTDRPRVPNRASRGASHRLALGLERTARVKALAREEGATLFAVLLAAYAVLLGKYTGEDDIVIGSPTSGRTQSRFEGVLGCFVNPVAMRVRCEPTMTFRALLGQVRATVLGALSHQDYPFGIISERLNVRRNSADARLFQVDFALQKPQRYAEVTGAIDDSSATGRGTIDFGGLRIQLYDMPQQEGQLDLTLELIESNGALVGSFKYDANLFGAATIARMERHLLELLDSATAAPDQSLPALNLLSDVERRRLLVDLNATEANFPRGEGYAQYFEQQVRRAPDAVAVIDDEGSLTYAELNTRANRVARALVAAGVGPDQPVALLAERGRGLLTWIIATLKAGGAYLPLDPRLPTLRHVQILRQSRPGVVVVADALAGRLDEALGELASDTRPRVLRAGDLDERVGNADDLPARAGGENLAYIIFTSGSTGSPKGAMVPQRAMLNHFWSKIRGYALTSTDVVVQSAPQGFDISVWQFLAVLLAGGRVRIAPDAVTREPERLFALVESAGATVLEIVPSFLRAFLDELPPGTEQGTFGRLRWLILGAEALAPDLCRRWLARWPGTPMLNTYGPSECADDATRHLVSIAPASDELVVPIGRPIDNVRLYVVDRHLALVPEGVPGELCIGGVSVGLGYLNDPERTALAFVPDPFMPEPSARLYRTGDRVRWRADGTLEFLGRIDQQVKIRGFRIELGEIESVLRTYRGVREVAVLTRDGADGVPRIVAFVTTADGVAPDVADAQRHVRERLPDYMVPSSIAWLAELPLLANGKIDRRALQRIEGAVGALVEHVPPLAGVEQELAAVWAELLGSNHIGRHDSFFQLGGHSILAARLMARVRQHLGVELPVRALFETPTLAGLAEQIELARWAAVGTKPMDVDVDDDREQFTL